MTELPSPGSVTDEAPRSRAAPGSSAGIAAWMPAGMLDWPGRITSTVFLSGCNLRCPACHNPDLLVTSRLDGAHDALLQHLHARRDWIDGVVITGGEPTQDPALFCLLHELAELCVPVKLDTNGTRPRVLRSVVEAGLVAAVALDVKALPSRYDAACGTPDAWQAVESSIDVILGSGVSHEFRTTAYPAAVALDDLPVIARTLAGAKRYVIQQFRPQRTLRASAGAARPYSPEELAEAASACSTYLPTTVRGA